MKQFMEEKNFTYTLPEVPKNFKNIPCGSYKDSDIDLSIEIFQELDELKFSLLVNTYPAMNPLWIIVCVKIQDEEDKFFIVNEKKGKKIQKAFISQLKSDYFTSNSTITYKITQVPSYICQLANDGCVCYLNCALQLLFHLSKLRSLLFTLTKKDNVNWLNDLENLFETMCTYKSNLSTEQLTESFGWPSLARRIPHDASEFIQIILDKIRNNSEFDSRKREIFDEIFASQVQTPKEIESRYVLNLSYIKKTSSFIETFENDMKDQPFIKFPEVLFISVSGLRIDDLPRELDLNRYSTEKEPNQKHSQYILAGIILRINKQSGISHFTSFVRASTEDIWLYFSDTVQITYSWKYNKKLKKVTSPIDSEIKNKLSSGQIHFLMYIAKDVFDQYFTYTTAMPRIRPTDSTKDDFDGPNRLIMITKSDDIRDYVQSGHTDFEDVGTSLKFELSSELPYSAVYDRISKEMNKPIGTFLLRTESKTRSPSFHEFPNKPSQLKNIRRYQIHLYYEEITSNREFLSQYIPFYFLLFKFNQQSYIHNITSNLIRPSPMNFLKSTPIPGRNRRGLERHNSDYLTESEKRMEREESSNSSLNQEKNCFQYLTNLVLSTSSSFQSIIDQLLQIINEKDEHKKDHSKIELFTAEYAEDGKQKIGYKKIDVTKKIKECLPQIFYGTYIYVQCEDDFIEKDKNYILDQKFLFFKNMSKALDEKHYKLPIYPKEIPNVFMMENFSVPVTFCKLTNPQVVCKSMLFPTKIQLRSIEDLKKIICVAMKETYPSENGLMQLFFGFRSEKWPPFHDQLFGKKDINSITYILNFSLKNSVVTPKVINLSSGSSVESFTNHDEDYEIDTDNDFISNIFIHYHIFETFDRDKEISVRVYFSENSISVKYISQVKVSKDAKVEDIALNLKTIFDGKLSSEDMEILTKIEKKEATFSEYYRILQTSNGKISRELKLEFSLNSNMEVRIERIPDDYDNDQILCYIPVFYGARYSPNNDSAYNTNYIGSVGTPFYFPVLKSDLEDKFIEEIRSFKRSKLFRRLRSMITEKEIYYNLFVVNYFGTIQDVRENDLKTIIDKKLNYSICIKKLNASTFIDEVKFFNDGIRIIK